MKLPSVLIATTFAVVFGAASAPAQQPPMPRIAVAGFNSQGIARWWGSGSFDPGDALSEIMTDKLVNANAYDIVDRTHTDQVLKEQGVSREGDVAPSTEAKLGRMIGANYLIFGRIIEFDKTGGSNGGTGGMLSHVAGGLLGGVGGSSEKVTLKVTMRVVETNTGRIAASVESEAAKSGGSFSLAGIGGSGGGSYSSSDFASSTVGQLLATVAEDLVKKMPARLVTAAAAPTISGKIIGVDGDSIIINAGTDKGVTVGTYFTVYQIKELKDPDTGKVLESHSKRGSIEIVSVDKQTAVGKVVDGTAKPGSAVMSGE
ncbi:MAG: hypothetical protein IAI50_01730 [Candidatus Eremiobacteraeota bacterium]|nr:hypothetical protein [Candidatus Eremiobacteraeota bacterium]